jgi:hypothetical protein
MVEDTNCPKNYWEMKHQPASPATVRKINQDWEECKKWRKEQEEKMKKLKK